MELICSKTVERLALFNNVIFRCAELQEGHITVEELDTGESSEIPVARLAELFRSAAALTTIQVQGRTLQGTVCLHEWSHSRFSRRHAIVGLSRATSMELVSMGPY